MSPTSPIGFWSYTHRDDALDDGRIRRLATLIANEYELLTGAPLRLFVDNQALEWGDEWLKVIDHALSDAVFFIPIVTPLYLRSEQCRREFVEFAGRAESAGAGDLLLPILYSNTPEIGNDETPDEVARLISATQYVDWRTLRITDVASNEHRSAVNKLASRLSSIRAQFDERVPIVSTESNEAEILGPIDLIARAEDAAPRWVAAMTEMQEQLEVLQEVAVISTERLKESDRRGAGAKGRLVVFHDFAGRIDHPASRIAELGAAYAHSVIDLNAGVRAIIEAAAAEDASDGDRAALREFLRVIGDVAATTSRISDGVGQLTTAVNEGARLSVVLRKPLAKLQQGLSSINDANTVLGGWKRLADDYDH